MEHDTLARALSAMNHAEAKGKPELLIAPASKVISAVLEILKAEGYIHAFEVIDNKKGGQIKVLLAGKINKIGSIKPRYSISKSGYETFEQSYLPAKGFGRLIVSTSKGYMTHENAKQKKLGGVLLAYVY
ncbi:MAG: 30S ribosomal protein S8 [Nanoarchaeota archaeon]